MKYIFIHIIMIFSFILSLTAQEKSENIFNEQGEKTGYWKTKYENGNTRYEGYFKNGQPVGIMKRYFPNGALKARIQFDDNSQTSYSKFYYENGKLAAEGKYINKKKDSTWNFYSFYNNRLAFQEHYTHGLKDGKAIKYYDNDSIAEVIIWKNGEKDGLWKQFYEDGTQRLKGFHKDGQRNGEFITWFPNGNISTKGQYKNGLMDGVWKHYKENGEHDINIEYDMGRMIINPALEKRQQEFSSKIEELIREMPEPNTMEKR